ncbi:type IV pilin protein [Xanthomonas vasicola]|uniref:type IV pilin protein n=1 Tax=Xanthomonas vasicola TaxID=56459 RepID=UPI0001CBF709|nr:type IV pilin protein [Xanthomonas vasicola]AZR30615.1 type IV pilin protein [Xanthomonas vasicola pv. musacearum NCPPB 4379]MBV7280618.1 type IV pilin protein [Xanthomonas vasicola pv. musacearum]MBV7290565.1 type IV pilin protein [Xanthomonas vasicola pv. musacearum]MDO6951461.1 type IV pilin protein [Xanthomonas vasicola]RJL82436.1 type IV pilin protein [Xanthomonas vasicola]
MYRIARSKAQVGSRYLSGFSLMELMIAVAIVGILSAIALTNYQSSVIKSRRSAAAACLQEGAQTMERYYTTKMTYVGGSMGSCSSDISNFYTLSSGTPAVTSFTLTATPTSKQNDPKCGTLSIDQKGVRTASGTDGASQCF